MFQVTTAPLNWVYLLVWYWVLTKSAKTALWLAFAVGLILDLVGGTRLGISSSVFLLFSFLLGLIGQKMVDLHWLLIFFGGFISQLLYSFIVFQQWCFPTAFAFGFILALGYLFIIKPKMEKEIGIKI